MSVFTSPEYLSLMTACAKSPNDDTTILVLADWLEEQGYTSLAVFMRVDVDYHRRWGTDREMNDREKWNRKLLFQKAMSDLDCLAETETEGLYAESTYSAFFWRGLPVKYDDAMPFTHDLKHLLIRPNGIFQVPQ